VKGIFISQRQAETPDAAALPIKQVAGTVSDDAK
jgi:hypothetical protein